MKYFLKILLLFMLYTSPTSNIMHADAISETIYKWYETDMHPIGDKDNKAADNGFFPSLPSTMIDPVYGAKNKSCIPLSGGFMQMLYRLANDITTLGFAELIYHDFSMLNGNAEGTPVGTDGYGNRFPDDNFPSPIVSASTSKWPIYTKHDKTYTQNPSGTMRCKVPSDDIYVCYTNTFNFLKPHCEKDNIYRFCADKNKCDRVNKIDALNIKDMGAYQSHKFSGIVPARSVEAADNICVQIWFPTGWTTMGCKKRLPDPNPGNQIDSCYVNPACASLAQLNSKNFVSIFGAMSYCLTDGLNRLMTLPETCGTNYVVSFRQALKNTVLIALSIYIAFIGIKILFGKITFQNKAEIFIYIGKIILVLYLAIGFSPDSAGRMAESGVNYIYKYALDISTQLLDMVISTASENNLCRFSLNDYSSGFKMLRVWDELDCRLSYYLGIGSVSAALALGETAALGAITAGLALPLMFILSFSTILMGILLIMFFIFLLSTMIYIVETFAACAFLILLLIVFAPIFVPMVLFEYTKQSFMSWWRLILGFTLQPMIIGVYIALMLPIMDSIIFPGCIFSKWTVNNVPVIGASSSSNTGAIFSKTTAEAIPSSSGYSPITLNGQISSSTDQYGSINVDQSSSTKTRYGDLGIGNMITKTVDFPVLIDEDQTQECKSSWGYKIAIVKNKYNHIKTGSPSEFADSMLFPIKSLADKDQWLSLLSAVLQFTLFSVLFYNFAGLVGGIAGDITGSIDISSLTSGPNALTDKAIGLISKAVKRQLPGGAKSLHAAKKEGSNPTGDKDKEGKDDDHDKKDADKDLTSGDKKDGNEQGAQNSGGANEASQGAQNSENIKVPRTGGVK